MFKFLSRPFCTHAYRKESIWGRSERSENDNLVINSASYVCRKCGKEIIIEDITVEKNYYTKKDMRIKIRQINDIQGNSYKIYVLEKLNPKERWSHLATYDTLEDAVKWNPNVPIVDSTK